MFKKTIVVIGGVQIIRSPEVSRLDVFKEYVRKNPKIKWEDIIEDALRFLKEDSDMKSLQRMFSQE